MAKDLKILQIDGQDYNVGFSSNDFRDADKADIARLIEKNFPLKVTLTVDPASSASDALNGAGSNVPKEVKISWTLKYEGNSSNEDASQYEGELIVGSETINLGGAEMGAGFYKVSLSEKTDISLTVNGKKASTTVYFAKPMYSGSLPYGETVKDFSDLEPIKPIATSILNMGVQTTKALSVDYVYWIAIPDNLEIKNAVLPDFLNAEFDMMEIEESPVSGYKLYRSGKTETSTLNANISYKVKFS